MTTESAADGELLRRASHGDEDAFLLLYERHRTPVYRFACRVLGSPALAEDVTQECFLGLVRNPDGYRGDRASLRTYLCAAARNIAHGQLRRQGRLGSLEEWAEDLPDPAGDQPLERLMRDEEAAAVQQAVAGLPVLQREALVLFEYEDMSLAEVAAVVGADVGTVKSRLHRARQRLRRVLAAWLSPAAPPATAKETP